MGLALDPKYRFQYFQKQVLQLDNSVTLDTFCNYCNVLTMGVIQCIDKVTQKFACGGKAKIMCNSQGKDVY